MVFVSDPDPGTVPPSEGGGFGSNSSGGAGGEFGAGGGGDSGSGAGQTGTSGPQDGSSSFGSGKSQIEIEFDAALVAFNVRLVDYQVAIVDAKRQLAGLRRSRVADQKKIAELQGVVVDLTTKAKIASGMFDGSLLVSATSVINNNLTTLDSAFLGLKSESAAAYEDMASSGF